jgi:hypothetical protein
MYDKSIEDPTLYSQLPIFRSCTQVQTSAHRSILPGKL